MGMDDRHEVLHVDLVSWMMAYNDEPVVLVHRVNLLLKPIILDTAILRHDVLVELAWALLNGIARREFLAARIPSRGARRPVGGDAWVRVKDDEGQVLACCKLDPLRVVAGGHVPAFCWINLRELHLRVDIVAILVVAQDGVPRDLQSLGCVDGSVILADLVVRGVLDSAVIKIITHVHDKLHVVRISGLPHLFCHILDSLHMVASQSHSTPVAESDEGVRRRPSH
mmetsp:Transcript_9706/g.27387  ORF Transcript_9706/g.27387 Transcript_9706/m.27387 type:complete len:226 (-) Transcript_9706:98-775(-)